MYGDGKSPDAESCRPPNWAWEIGNGLGGHSTLLPRRKLDMSGEGYGAGALPLILLCHSSEVAAVVINTVVRMEI